MVTLSAIGRMKTQFLPIPPKFRMFSPDAFKLRKMEDTKCCMTINRSETLRGRTYISSNLCIIRRGPSKSTTTNKRIHLSDYCRTATEFASLPVVWNRDAGVTRLAARRLPNCSTTCSQSSGDKSSRSRIGGADFCTAPRLLGFN